MIKFLLLLLLLRKGIAQPVFNFLCTQRVNTIGMVILDDCIVQLFVLYVDVRLYKWSFFLSIYSVKLTYKVYLIVLQKKKVYLIVNLPN